MMSATISLVLMLVNVYTDKQFRTFLTNKISIDVFILLSFLELKTPDGITIRTLSLRKYCQSIGKTASKMKNAKYPMNSRTFFCDLYYPLAVAGLKHFLSYPNAVLKSKAMMMVTITVILMYYRVTSNYQIVSQAGQLSFHGIFVAYVSVLFAWLLFVRVPCK